MSFDYRKLRGRIIEKFGSVREFAKAYGISLTSMSRKLNGRTTITTADIVKMSAPEFLDIPTNEVYEYFFVKKVQNN
jgi:hypothetical protein